MPPSPDRRLFRPLHQTPRRAAVWQAGSARQVRSGPLLRVTSGGTKTFTVRGRIKDGPEVRATLGRWPNLTPEAAGRFAWERLNHWAVGEDHREVERAFAARKLTLGEAGRQYIAQHRHRLKPGYVKAIDQLLRGPLGRLARRPEVEINSEAVLRWHQVQASKSSADRAARVLRALLKFAADRHGLRPNDGGLGTDMLKAMRLWRPGIRRTTMIADMPRWRSRSRGCPTTACATCC
jgi:hypothetical protein